MAARWRCSLSLSPPTLAALDVRIYATASTSFRLLAIDLALICISSLRKIYNPNLQGKLSRCDPRSRLRRPRCRRHWHALPHATECLAFTPLRDASINRPFLLIPLASRSARPVSQAALVRLAAAWAAVQMALRSSSRAGEAGHR